jgi:hypothetical protein
MRKLLIGASFLIAMAAPAWAVTSYMLPSDFWPDGQRVNVEAAYTGTFFTPQIALASDFVVIQPDGTNGIYDHLEIGAQSTRLSAGLLQGGTYRLTSGERLGAVTILVGVDGQWRPLAQGETPPEGAPTTTLQTVTVAEAYITRGAPTRTAVDRNIGRLSIHAVTHPNQILVSQGFQVQLLFDGQPFPNMPIVLYANGEPDTNTARYFVTDANGAATITFDQPGRYVIAARHRANAPAGSEAAVRSYTTSLTFEAMTTLPEIVPIHEDPGPRRRPRRGLRN